MQGCGVRKQPDTWSCELTGGPLCREFVERDLAGWAKQNSQVTVGFELRNGRHPYVQGLYLSHQRHRELSLKNMGRDDIRLQLDRLRDMTGHKSPSPTQLKKWWFSKCDSPPSPRARRAQVPVGRDRLRIHGVGR